MADFYYNSSEQKYSRKILEIYSKEDLIQKQVHLYRNYDKEYYECNGNYAYIIGTAEVIQNEKSSFIKGILTHFNESKIPHIQKVLIGQYIILIYANSHWYIFSDLLNIRTIYYDLERGEVSSNIGALSAFHTGFDDEYKSFEHQAMDKCLYPVMLGNSTSIKSIMRLQPCQYIVIGNDIEVRDFTIHLNNTKTKSAEACADSTLSVLTNIISKFANCKAVSTITGGYDSRLISSLCAKIIPDTALRIAIIEEKKFVDLSIGKRVAKALGKELKIYQTIPEEVRDEYTLLTHGLSKDNNLIVMGMIKHSADYEIGFGGTMGTELFSTLAFYNKEQLIDSFVKRAANSSTNERQYVDSFRQALYEQLNFIESHIKLKDNNPRDYVRLFMVFMTARFSSPLLALSDIFGHQMEPYATYATVESGLQIPYHYQGDSKTFGRFYLIPKLMMKKVNYQVGKIDTTHHQPLLPVSLCTLPHYIIGKIKTKMG